MRNRGRYLVLVASLSILTACGEQVVPEMGKVLTEEVSKVAGSIASTQDAVQALIKVGQNLDITEEQKKEIVTIITDSESSQTAKNIVQGVIDNDMSVITTQFTEVDNIRAVAVDATSLLSTVLDIYTDNADNQSEELTKSFALISTEMASLSEKLAK